MSPPTPPTATNVSSSPNRLFLAIVHIFEMFCLSIFVIKLLSPQGGLGQEWLPSLADARRNLNHSRELCEELGVCGWHWGGIAVFHFTDL